MATFYYYYYYFIVCSAVLCLECSVLRLYSLTDADSHRCAGQHHDAPRRHAAVLGQAVAGERFRLSTEATGAASGARLSGSAPPVAPPAGRRWQPAQPNHPQTGTHLRFCKPRPRTCVRSELAAPARLSPLHPNMFTAGWLRVFLDLSTALSRGACSDCDAARGPQVVQQLHQQHLPTKAQAQRQWQQQHEDAARQAQDCSPSTPPQPQQHLRCNTWSHPGVKLMRFAPLL